MKKNYSIVCLVQTIIMVLAVLFPVIASSQELTDAEKQEKCQNNRNKIAELETALKIINADLSETMEKKEIEDAKDKINYLRKMEYKHFDRNRSGLGDIGKDEWIKIERIAAQYNFNFKDCEKRRTKGLEVPMCLMDLSDLVKKKIEKAVSLENLRPALINKKNEIEKDLAWHKNNLIFWRCDLPIDKKEIEVDKKETADFDYSKISGTWQSDWGPVTLSVNKSSVYGSWKQTATETGQITGGSFDAKTKTLKFTYSQAWNKKTGKVTLNFSETPTEYTLDGSWGHDDGNGGGSWGMTKKK